MASPQAEAQATQDYKQKGEKPVTGLSQSSQITNYTPKKRLAFPPIGPDATSEAIERQTLLWQMCNWVIASHGQGGEVIREEHALKLP